MQLNFRILENVFGLVYNFLFSKNENNENAFGLSIFDKIENKDAIE